MPNPHGAGGDLALALIRVNALGVVCLLSHRFGRVFRHLAWQHRSLLSSSVANKCTWPMNATPRILSPIRGPATTMPANTHSYISDPALNRGDLRIGEAHAMM